MAKNTGIINTQLPWAKLVKMLKEHPVIAPLRGTNKVRWRNSQ
jgi:hypothetical protein